jgi:hypothetical protein
MKNLITFILTFIMTIPVLAVGPVPKALKDGVITVTLADGKVYTFSANEYAVVRRGTEDKVLTKSEGDSIAKTHFEEGKKAQPKNIVSVGAVRSKNGFDISETASTVDVSSKKSIGGSLQYQRRVLDNKYIGGRIDSNGGAEINVGVGF